MSAKQPSSAQLNTLNAYLHIYGTAYLYTFLKLAELHTTGDFTKGTKQDAEVTDGILGLPYSKWAEEKQAELDRLCGKLSEEKWLRLYAEMIYFLIFSISGYVVKYTGLENERLVLDKLFEFFHDRELWPKGYPHEDAYKKYAQPNNDFLKTFVLQVCKIADQEDASLLWEFGAQVTAIFRFYVQPTIDKLFWDSSK